MRSFEEAFEKVLAEAADGNTSLCVTFENEADDSKWIQMTWDSINASYPNREDPLKLLRGFGLSVPRYVEVIGWEAEKYVTFSHGADDLPALSAFVVQYVTRILGVAPDLLNRREELL